MPRRTGDEMNESMNANANNSCASLDLWQIEEEEEEETENSLSSPPSSPAPSSIRRRAGFSNSTGTIGSNSGTISFSASVQVFEYDDSETSDSPRNLSPMRQVPLRVDRSRSMDAAITSGALFEESGRYAGASAVMCVCVMLHPASQDLTFFMLFYLSLSQSPE
jgi:hypothetical protein